MFSVTPVIDNRSNSKYILTEKFGEKIIYLFIAVSPEYKITVYFNFQITYFYNV